MMIPNLFKGDKIPEKIPEGMQKIVDKINKCKTKECALRTAYDELTRTHSGIRYGVWKNFFTIFYRDINKIWEKKVLTCTGLTFLIRVLLVKSRHFTEDDVVHRNNITDIICPHVFLEVIIGKKCIPIDIWGHHLGVPFGKKVESGDWFKKRNFRKKKR